MIKISKDGIEYTYNSTNQACNMNGATSPMNKQAQLKYLAKIGFDIDSLVEDEKTTTTTRTSTPVSMIEKIINQCKVIDKDRIKTLEAELNKVTKNIKRGDDVDRIVELNEEIDKLQNPIVTRETVMNYVGKLYDEFMAKPVATETGAETTTETPSEETPSNPEPEQKPEPVKKPKNKKPE